jgi:hypothetical protein
VIRKFILFVLLPVAVFAGCTLQAVIVASGEKGLFRKPYTTVRTVEEEPQTIEIDGINAGARGDTVTIYTACGGTCRRGYCWEIK